MKLPEVLKPYKGILYFITALLAAHLFWKFLVQGDESGIMVTFLGADISRPFIVITSHLSYVSESILNFLGLGSNLYPNNVIRYQNGNSVQIAWGCTGLKQAFIFTVIMVFANGKWYNKLWYIPIGWLAIYIFNDLRIITIAAAIKNYPESFIFLHEYFLKYLFYILLFFIWVFWEEKIVGKSEKEALIQE